MIIDALFQESSKINMNEALFYAIFYVLPLFIQFINEEEIVKYVTLIMCVVYRCLYIVLYFKLNKRQGMNDWEQQAKYESGCIGVISCYLNWIFNTIMCDNGMKFILTVIYVTLRFLDPDYIKAPNNLQEVVWTETQLIKLMLWTFLNIFLIYLIVMKQLEFLRASETFSP
jgi:Ca2+/Na+ antiporter